MDSPSPSLLSSSSSSSKAIMVHHHQQQQHYKSVSHHHLTKHTNRLRESKRKLANLELARRKRSEINDLINKEYRIRNGALNLLKACNNENTKERLKLEITFIESKIKYLKDQLSELNCDWTLFKMKNSSSLINNNKNIATNAAAVASNNNKTAAATGVIVVEDDDLKAPSSVAARFCSSTTTSTTSSASSSSSSSSSSSTSSNSPLPYSTYSIIESSCCNTTNGGHGGGSTATAASAAKCLPYSVSLSLIPANQYQYDLNNLHHQSQQVDAKKQPRKQPLLNFSPPGGQQLQDLSSSATADIIVGQIAEFIPNHHTNGNSSGGSGSGSGEESAPSAGSFSFSPSTASTVSIVTTATAATTATISNSNSSKTLNNKTFHQHNSEQSAANLEAASVAASSAKSTDIMIYLTLKETINKMDFSKGFRNFITYHYRDDASRYSEQIRQFNYFRESTIRLGYEPGIDSIQRLFEYFNSLHLIERRFFQMSQCDFVHFTWYDCINGIECTQKSIQLEKASILFNAAALYTQLAAICCDDNEKKLDEQQSYWQNAAGCLNYLNKNFSNSPSLDMCSFVLNFFIEIFMCQAFEIKTKIMMNDLNNGNSDVSSSTSSSKIDEPRRMFTCYAKCAKIYSHISDRYQVASGKLGNNVCIKNYLPEIWFYLIKVKSLYYKALSHYYASTAIMTPRIEEVHDLESIQSLFNSLHDKSATAAKDLNNNSHLNGRDPFLVTSNSQSEYFQKQMSEQMKFYDSKILNDADRVHLARAHMRESIVWLEEAIRQHSFCRKFSKDDYLHFLLRHYHDISLDKFMHLDSLKSAEFDDELFDALPINKSLNEEISLRILEPDFQSYDSKDFFNIIGPIKVYTSENELSVPFSCILKKQSSQQTFGITVKGDCPVRINQVDPKSYAYNSGIREGDYLIAIQDQDVRWSKHNQVVERIRSHPNTVKLTLISVRPSPAVKEAAAAATAEQTATSKQQTTNNDDDLNLNKYSNDYDYYDSLNEKKTSSSSSNLVKKASILNNQYQNHQLSSSSNLKASKSMSIVNELTNLISSNSGCSSSSSSAAATSKQAAAAALKQINENHIWSNDQCGSSTVKCSSQKQRLYRLFKSPHSFILPNNPTVQSSSESSKSKQPSSRSFLTRKLFDEVNKTPLINDINNTNVAASKLCNLAKSASASQSLLERENKLGKGNSNGIKHHHHSFSFKSLSNLNATAAATSTSMIKFNAEDDEVKKDEDNNDFDESKLMTHLKAFKGPLTNTITLGRRFKRNVLKLSIFNSFSAHSTSAAAAAAAAANKPDAESSSASAVAADSTIAVKEQQQKKDELSAAVEINPTSSPSLFNNSSSSSSKKSVKKQKKLKELKKQHHQQQQQQNQIVDQQQQQSSSSAAAAAVCGNNKERLLKLNNQFESSASSLSIYKTL